MQFSSTCPAVSARHNKASRYSKQVNETISRFGAREQGPSRSRQAQAREQEKNEALLRYLSEIWFPSVPPKYKLFYPVFVAFSSILAWGSKVRKSKWQLQLVFFFQQTLWNCISCVSQWHQVSGRNKPLWDRATTLWCFCKGKQPKNYHQQKNKQKRQSNKTHVNCKSKSLLVKFCFRLHYRKSM